MKSVVIGQNADVKNAISEMLRDEPGFVVHEVAYEKPVQSTEVSLLENADLIVVDLTTARANTRFLIMEIREVFSNAKIVALHIYKEIDLVKPIMEAGADAYLPVDTSRAELMAAVRKINDGGKFLSGQVE